MLAQKQPLIQRVRNSSLVERLCAENLTGLNLTPKLRQHVYMLGRGALYTRRNSSASGCGVYRSENAGMSSANAVRICMAESLRFLEEGSSAPGQSGAKVRPNGVADAQTVEIPSPPKELNTGTHMKSRSRVLVPVAIEGS